MTLRKIQTIETSLPSCDVTIKIGDDLCSDLNKKIMSLKPNHVVLLYDRRLVAQKRELVRALKTRPSKKTPWNLVEISVEAGEGLKTASCYLKVFGALLAEKVRRDSVLIALGGGTVGDFGGFLASTYMRGIPWIGLPTTLLAMVDSSVGGKTAINHPQGKNLIGTFWQPQGVYCDLRFLKTLKSREIISGLGEAIKYGLIYDRRLFFRIQRDWKKILKLDSLVLSDIVFRSLSWKSRVVKKDERDETGIRELLNFGHTLGHALETLTGYRRFQHGEAIIWGMRFAVTLSYHLKILPQKDYLLASDFLSSIPLPSIPSAITFEKIYLTMTKDKKVKGGKLHFVVLNKIGMASTRAAVTKAELQRAYKELACQ